MTTLGNYLKGKGFKVDDSNVPYGRDTTWDKVKWIFVHHTASTCNASKESADANYIRTASGRYPPLAQIMLGQSGKVWMCSKQRGGQAEPGRASHAGEGSYPGIPTDCGNQMSLGIEVQCSGAHPLANHKDQYAVLIDLIADLCKRYGLDSTKVIGHKEYSSTGKIDPRDSMNTIRADVKAQMGSAQQPNEEDPLIAVVLLKSSTDQPIPADPSWNNIDFDSENDPQGWHADPGLYPSVGCKATGYAATYARINPKGGVIGDVIELGVIRQENKGDDSSWIDVDTISFVNDGSKRFSWSPSFKCYDGYKYRLRIRVAGTAMTLDYVKWNWLVSGAP